MSVLFSPFQLRGLALPNRIMVAPMCQYSPTTEGAMTDWHTIHSTRSRCRARGCSASRRPRGSESAASRRATAGCGYDATEAACARVRRRCAPTPKCAVAIQLAHAGRKASQQGAVGRLKQIRSTESGGWRSSHHLRCRSCPMKRRRWRSMRDGLDRVRRAFERRRSAGAARLRRHRDALRPRLSPA